MRRRRLDLFETRKSKSSLTEPKPRQCDGRRVAVLFLVRRAFLQTATTATLHALIEQREPVGEAGAPAALKILKSCEAEEMHATWKETERESFLEEQIAAMTLANAATERTESDVFLCVHLPKEAATFTHRKFVSLRFVWTVLSATQ